MTFRRSVTEVNGNEGITNTNYIHYQVEVGIGLGDIKDTYSGSIEVYMFSRVHTTAGKEYFATAEYQSSQSKLVSGTESVSLGPAGYAGKNQNWTLIGTYNRGDTVSVTSKCYYTASGGTYHESKATATFTIPNAVKPVVQSAPAKMVKGETATIVSYLDTSKIPSVLNDNNIGTFWDMFPLVTMADKNKQLVSDTVGFDMTYEMHHDTTNPRTDLLDTSQSWMASMLAGAKYLAINVVCYYEWYGSYFSAYSDGYVYIELTDEIKKLFAYDSTGAVKNAKLYGYDSSGKLHECKVYMFNSSGSPVQVQ